MSSEKFYIRGSTFTKRKSEITDKQSPDIDPKLVPSPTETVSNQVLIHWVTLLCVSAVPVKFI